MDLTTTNVLLAIMAAVSLLEAVVLVAILAGGYLLFRKVLRTIDDIERRQVAPAALRVNAILDDLKGISGVARNAAEGADAGVRQALAWLLRFARDTTRPQS